MSDLVLVRSKSGGRGQFLIGRGLYEKHPDDYVLVKVKSPSNTAEPSE